MSRTFALALALTAPLALAQAPAEQKPAPQKPAAKQPAKPAASQQKAQKAQGAQRSRGAQGTSKAHAKPTPEQIRRFNQLEKQEQSGKR